MVSLFLIAVMLLPLIGCRTMPSATGKDYEVVVIVQGRLWNIMEGEIRGTLQRPVFGVHTEKAFRLIQVEPEKPKPFNTWRKILVIGSVEGTPIVRDLLGDEELKSIESGKAYLKPLKNVWALGQYVLLCYTKHSEFLPGAFASSRETVFSLINDAFLEEERRRMFTSGVNEKIAEYFAGQYGFSILLPQIYRLADEDTLQVAFDDEQSIQMNAIRFFNINPQRSFLVCWKEGSLPQIDEEWVQKLRQAIGRIYYPGDELLIHRVESTSTAFGNLPAVRLRGVWENKEELQGGLFITYAFNCPENDRFYLIDGILYQPNPERSKYPYLVQLSMIMHSFDCSADSVITDVSTEGYSIDMDDLF